MHSGIQTQKVPYRQKPWKNVHREVHSLRCYYRLYRIRTSWKLIDSSVHCPYTAFLTWIDSDDTYTRDVIGVGCFSDRFITGREQANEGLDRLDRLLREINLHYQSHGVQANGVILTAILNFVTSTIQSKRWCSALSTYLCPASTWTQCCTTFIRIMLRFQ